MTSKIPNPSFIIINSYAQEITDLSVIIQQAFPSAAVHIFSTLNDYVVAPEVTTEEKVLLLFENSFGLSNDNDTQIISNYSCDHTILVFQKNLDFSVTQLLINLGVSEILLKNQFNELQLQHSFFVSFSRKIKNINDSAKISKSHFVTMLRLHYDDLQVTVDSNLTVIEASKNLVAKLETKSQKLDQRSLRDYIHEDDLWILEDIAPLFDFRDNIILQSVRFKVSTGYYQNFELNLLREPSNLEHYIITLKDAKDCSPEDILRRDNNERFSAVAESTNSTIYEMFLEERKLFTANNRGIYGIIEGDHLEEYFNQYNLRIHPEDRNRLEHRFKLDFIEPSRKPSSNQYRLLQPNGRYQTILERYRILSREGIPYKRVGALSDITQSTAQNALIALEKQLYEMDAEQDIDFCEVIAILESKLEELIPYSNCMVVVINEQGAVECASKRTSVQKFISEIAKITDDRNNPLSSIVADSGKMSEDERWSNTMEVTNLYNYNYFRTSPATNKEKEIIATIVLLFNKQLARDETEEKLIQRITNLVGILVAKNKALSETKRSKEQFELVGKATNDTIWEWNVDVDSITWNKGIFEIFGYREEDVESTSRWWFSKVHPEDSVRVSVKLYHFLEQKTDKWQDEYRFACADGSYKYVLDRGFLEKRADGKALRMIGSMQDITHSKIEEERLKLLSAAITQANDAVIITETPRSVYALPKIVYVNPAFSKMTGYQDDEVVGQSPQIFIGKNAMVEQQTVLSKANEFNKEFIFEAINRRKNGEEYWARFSMIPVSNNVGEHSHWISIQSDISKQKEQEKEKEQLIQELTRHNNDLKQFSYITSHNLRAPLSNLIGLLNLIDDITIEDEDLKEIIEGFSKSTHLLNQTINDLINIVIIKDNLSIDRETIIIEEIIKKILDQLIYTTSLYSPKITINTTHAPFIVVNKTYIESIFLNLITNALRYSDPTRKLEISITSEEVDDEILLRFKDNGVGINLERNSDKLFGLYQRFHDYPDSKGLGLYLVKSQVTSMGGTITVESELGKGSCFILAFKK